MQYYQKAFGFNFFHPLGANTRCSLKERVQKDKQRSTKHTHKTKDRVTRTPLEMGMT